MQSRRAYCDLSGRQIKMPVGNEKFASPLEIFRLCVLVGKAYVANIALFFGDGVMKCNENGMSWTDLDLVELGKKTLAVDSIQPVLIRWLELLKRRWSRSRFKLAYQWWKWTNMKMYSNVCTAMLCNGNNVRSARMTSSLPFNRWHTFLSCKKWGKL